MQRALQLLLVLCLPATALADGKVYPPVAFPANVTIPDQRALIHFTDGTQRLVIETRFTGSGTNFAWVVPLPSAPVIEEASTGLFPTLQYLFRPQIKHNLPRYYVGILLVTGFLVCLLCLAARSVYALLITVLLLFVLAGLLLPSLATSKAMASAFTDPAVSILNRRLVGIFETTTVASRDPKALSTWLRTNGFAVPTNSEPIIESYLKDGWVFVAAKVQREDTKLDTSTPHPLSFSFKTKKPVYPMRLTGVDNGPVTVELFVFGPERAEAKYFKVERCTQPAYPDPPGEDYTHWLRWSPETPNIVHPLLRKWVAGSPVATKLTARLTPAQMREDVWLRWSAFRETRNHLYSRSGALTRALNWGTGLFAAGLFGIGCLWLASDGPASKRFTKRFGVALLTGALVVSGIYLALPKTEVRLVKRPPDMARSAIFYLYEWLLDTKPVTRAVISAEARRLIANPDDDNFWVPTAKRYGGRGWDNFLLGGDIREEDSPGNFTLREHGDQLEFVAYDAQGAAHVMPWTLELRRPQ